MTIDPNDSNHIIADAGKCFIRKSDQFNFGSEMVLGLAYYIGGVKLQVPIQEIPEHFDEVDIPEEPEEPGVEVFSEDSVEDIIE